jgi:hypothetical protein
MREAKTVPVSSAVTVHWTGGPGGTLAGTTDSGTMSCGPRHFDRRTGMTQATPVEWDFFARQQGATPSSTGAGAGSW